MVVILAVDPDARGSIALLDCQAWTLDLYAIPNEYRTLSSGKRRLEVDPYVLVAILNELILSVPAATNLSCWIESQHSRPMQDSGSTFTAAFNYGSILTAFVAGLFQRNVGNVNLGRREVHFVAPDVWKQAMRVSADKAQTRDFATMVFPECAHAWKLISKHTSAAEAALLAVYGASQQGIKIPRGTVIKPFNEAARVPDVRSLTRK